MQDHSETRQLFELFNEIGIIAQLSSSLLNQRLPQGLHVSHFSVINHLVRLGDGQTPLAMAKAFQVTKATMTHTLGILSKRGFIEIRPNPQDGRSKLVFLTGDGRQFRASAIASLAPMSLSLMDKLNLHDADHLLARLRHIRQILDENRDI